jgi:hypothetical protein
VISASSKLILGKRVASIAPLANRLLLVLWSASCRKAPLAPVARRESFRVMRQLCRARNARQGSTKLTPARQLASVASLANQRLLVT